MNKLMYRFVATRKKKKKEIDPFLDTVCPFRASRVKRFLEEMEKILPRYFHPVNTDEHCS